MLYSVRVLDIVARNTDVHRHMAWHLLYPWSTTNLDPINIDRRSDDIPSRVLLLG